MHKDDGLQIVSKSSRQAYINILTSPALNDIVACRFPHAIGVWLKISFFLSFHTDIEVEKQKRWARNKNTKTTSFHLPHLHFKVKDFQFLTFHS